MNDKVFWYRVEFTLGVLNPIPVEILADHIELADMLIQPFLEGYLDDLSVRSVTIENGNSVGS